MNAVGRNSYLGGHSQGRVASNYSKTSTKRNITKVDKAALRKETSAQEFAKLIAKAIVMGWKVPKSPPHLREIVGRNSKSWFVARSDYQKLLEEAESAYRNDPARKKKLIRTPRILQTKRKSLFSHKISKR